MSYTVSPLDIDRHRDTMTALWCESFRDPNDDPFVAAGFAWLYEQERPAMSYTWMVGDSEGGNPVGCASIFRSDRWVAGQTLSTAIVTTMTVTKRHRTLAPSVALQRALIGGAAGMGVDLLVGKPSSPQAAAVCARAGFTQIGETEEWVNWLPDSADAAPPDGASDARMEFVDQPDARFDHLWQRARDNYGVVGDKSAAFLSWRYAFYKTLGHRYCCLVDAGSGELLAYAAYYAHHGGLLITDLLAERPDSTNLYSLIWQLLNHARTEGHMWVGFSYFGMSCFEARLPALGFRPKQERVPFILMAGPAVTSEVRDILVDRNRWFTFGGEMHL
jgi:hypothetical protein